MRIPSPFAVFPVRALARKLVRRLDTAAHVVALGAALAVFALADLISGGALSRET